MGKAITTRLAAVESGDLKALIERLKTVGRYGDGTMNAIHEQDPEQVIRRPAEAQVDREGGPKNTLRAMAEDLDTAAWRHRVAEVEAELRHAYLDE